MTAPDREIAGEVLLDGAVNAISDGRTVTIFIAGMEYQYRPIEISHWRGAATLKCADGSEVIVRTFDVDRIEIGPSPSSPR